MWQRQRESMQPSNEGPQRHIGGLLIPPPLSLPPLLVSPSAHPTPAHHAVRPADVVGVLETPPRTYVRNVPYCTYLPTYVHRQRPSTEEGNALGVAATSPAFSLFPPCAHHPALIGPPLRPATAAPSFPLR